MKASALSALGQRTEAPPISWLMEQSLMRPRMISLAAGFTASETLPIRETRAGLNEILSSRKSAHAALQYGSTAGDPLLRRLTAKRLRALDRVREATLAYSPDRVIITNGSQQLLYMVTEALCNPGDIVLVEDPTYFVYLGIMQSHGLRARGIRLDPDGLDLAHLQTTLESLKRSRQLRRVKGLYLVSYYQNPTGITTSFAKKVGALKLLRRYERDAGHPIYLVEDAAYRELRFKGEDEQSALAARGFTARVIYAGTYSKPFATGVRVGFGVLPEPLRTVVSRLKGNHDFGTSNLLQQWLAREINEGRDQEHLRPHARDGRKARAMMRELKQHFPASAHWQEPRGGLYIWVRLPRSVETGVKSKLFQRAMARDVLYVPGELCYANDSTRRKPNHEMRLSFASASLREIRTGIARLGEVLHELTKERP